MSLNYRRGLHRAWLVATVVWVTAVAYDQVETMLYMRRFREERGLPPESFWAAFGFDDFLLWGIAPPLAALVAGHFLAWILKGFRLQD